MQRVSYFPWLMVLALTLILVPGSKTTCAQEMKFENVPGDTQLIPPLPKKLPDDLQKLVEWPSQNYIEANYARVDRSAQLPPVYPEGRNSKNAKPIIPGGMSPQVAMDEAQEWIRQILKAEWIPPDLAKRLVPLRSEAAPMSMVICRYKVDGNAIQIIQTRWGIGVVVKPKMTGSLDKAGEFGNHVFLEFLNQGKELAELSQKREQSPSEHLALFGVDPVKIKAPDILENWWGTTTWYTDGQAVAALFRKRAAGEQHTPTSKDPWF
jgi:hypothetical protein